MSRGYFTIAQGMPYLRMAYALALSLKLTQPDGYNKLAVGVDPNMIDSIPQKWADAFDAIVPIPWNDDAVNSSWKLENEWKSYWMTPYENTIKLDADMLFTADVSQWWEVLEHSDMVFAEKPITYSGELITDDACRKCFTANNLPNVYSAFWFFKKNEPCAEFFELMRDVTWNWQRFWEQQLEPNTRPQNFSTDVACAVVQQLLEIPNRLPIDSAPTFVHMKSELQNWKLVPDSWQDALGTYMFVDGAEFKFVVGNYRQLVPFHYHEKNFLTDKRISTLEQLLELKWNNMNR